MPALYPLVQVEHLFIPSEEDGQGSVSAVIFLRDKGQIWLYHYIAYAWKDKSQYVINTIEMTSDPGDLKGFGEKFLRTFEATINRFGGQDRMLTKLVDFRPMQVVELLNKTYDSLWAMNIRPGRPPRKVEAQVRKICARYTLRLVDVWYKSEVPLKERIARIPRHMQPRY